MALLLGVAALAGNPSQWAPVLARTDCYTDSEAVFDAALAHWRASGMPPGTVGMRASTTPPAMCCGPDAAAIAVNAGGEPLAELTLAGDCSVVRLYVPPMNPSRVRGEVRPVDPGPLPSMRAEVALVTAWKALRGRRLGIFDDLVAVRTEPGWDVWAVAASRETLAVVRVDRSGAVVEVRDEVRPWVLPAGAEAARKLEGFEPAWWPR